MKFKKILVINIPKDRLDPNYWERLNDLTDKIINIPNEINKIQKELADTDCILTGFQIDVGKKEIDAAADLKYVSPLATAYGKIDTAYAKKKGIVVSNVPGYATESVAEFVFATLLENIREIALAREKAKQGNYSSTGIKGSEIKDKIFAILGLGRIGARTAQIAKGFGADVRYWSKNRKRDFEKSGIKYQDADALISKADIISLHFAETEETTRFLNRKRIKSMKNGAIIISTVPNEITDMDALEESLKKGNVTFITDHADELSYDDVKRLSKYKNCILYPSIGFVSNEARIAKQEIFFGNIEGFLKGKPQNVVN